MRELPLLMNGPMVRAILEGRKTVTRRVVKPTGADHITPFIGADNRPTGEFGWCPHPCLITKHIRPPYQVGDRLYVRETAFRMPHPAEAGLTPKDLPRTWDAACDAAGQILYRADMESRLADMVMSDGERWTPSIHMPKSWARIWLEVTDVRVERLQDITEKQAVAEGLNAEPFPGPWWQGYLDLGDGELVHQQSVGAEPPDWMIEPKPMKSLGHLDRSAVDAFVTLWNGLAKPGTTWDDNPWVWVVEFRRVEVARG